ncbi:DUF2730 family protein [Blastochloris tepida]|uniref:DUF2730 domain-containing protein n=1 Tax=Blastochloris tepida TaxID=2233851 RepID=A0A348FYJ0_9HYPH|nr:DUF2730 family protein [Blastochloris tepida]BBF92373.1 hypothetical protein BLTE_10580 [Blastochloris tepida]
MDLDTTLKVATLLFAVGSAIYSWVSARNKATTDKVEGIDRRLAAVEGEIAHLPDKDTSHRMEISITDMRGEIRVLAEQLKPVAAISDRLQEFLLEQARR